MSKVLRKCMKVNVNLLFPVNTNVPFVSSGLHRNYSDDKFFKDNSFSNSSILIESGLNVHELPLVVRKLRNFSDFDEKPESEPPKHSADSLNFKLIQDEFKQCADLKDVFSLLSKCTKITPNIALGAIERIYELEKNSTTLNVDAESNIIHINLAKGAILDKLLRVVMETEDTQTILNILNTESTFMEPYKSTFSDELLLRVIDNKLNIEQLCEFMEFLIRNKFTPKYFETIDKLWIGFVEKEQNIDESNISKIFQVLSGLKSSKRTVLSLLEQRLTDLWCKIKVSDMLIILDVFIQEKFISLQSFTVVGTWLYANIHAVDQESLLDIISKLTRLNYSDNQVEKAVEKYMKLKGPKIKTPILIVGILNYCQHFKIRNEVVLDACSNYFVLNKYNIPQCFLKSMIHPYGYLKYDPTNSFEFWKSAENILSENFEKMSAENICSIVLSFIYNQKYPINIVNKLFNAEYRTKATDLESGKLIHIIDTALSLECSEHHGPLLPKDQWSNSVPQDLRIANIIKKTKDIFETVAGGCDKLSTAVMVPYIYAHDTYLIDVMIHPAGLGSHTVNWKSKSNRNENIAILIHLPDHYCSDNVSLIGPQAMRHRHLRILGMKVASLKYSTVSQFYTSCNLNGLREYILDSIKKADPCIDMV